MVGPRKNFHRAALKLSALKHCSQIGLALGKAQLSVKREQSRVKPYTELEEFLLSELVAWLVLHVLFP